MTPKEKAEELVKKFFEFNHRVKWDDINDEWTHDYIQAKECALIAVDEIKKHTYMGKSKYKNDNNSFEYWQEVKQEIKKL
jgi:hypothetical protein